MDDNLYQSPEVTYKSPARRNADRRIDSTSRLLNTFFLTFHIGWMEFAPAIHRALGDREEAGWVFMFLFPSLVIGAIVGILAIITRKKDLAWWFYLVLIVHICIGFGLHPR